MTNNRSNFRDYIKEKTGIEHLYFQPPSTIKMDYPAIIYSYDNIKDIYADNDKYQQFLSYQVILVDKDPDSVCFHKLTSLPKCVFNRHYTADNLNHFVFTIYY